MKQIKDWFIETMWWFIIRDELFEDILLPVIKSHKYFNVVGKAFIYPLLLIFVCAFTIILAMGVSSICAFVGIIWLLVVLIHWIFTILFIKPSTNV